MCIPPPPLPPPPSPGETKVLVVGPSDVDPQDDRVLPLEQPSIWTSARPWVIASTGHLGRRPRDVLAPRADHGGDVDGGPRRPRFGACRSTTTACAVAAAVVAAAAAASTPHPSGAGASSTFIRPRCACSVEVVVGIRRVRIFGVWQGRVVRVYFGRGACGQATEALVGGS